MRLVLVVCFVACAVARAVDPLSVQRASVRVEGLRQLQLSLDAPVTLRIENPNGPIHLFATDASGVFAIVDGVADTPDRRPIEFVVETYELGRARIALGFPDETGTANLSVAIPARLLAHLYLKSGDRVVVEDMDVEPPGTGRIVAVAPGATGFRFKNSVARGGLVGVTAKGATPCAPLLSFNDERVRRLFAFPDVI